MFKKALLAAVITFSASVSTFASVDVEKVESCKTSGFQSEQHMRAALQASAYTEAMSCTTKSAIQTGLKVLDAAADGGELVALCKKKLKGKVQIAFIVSAFLIEKATLLVDELPCENPMPGNLVYAATEQACRFVVYSYEAQPGAQCLNFQY